MHHNRAGDNCPIKVVSSIPGVAGGAKSIFAAPKKCSRASCGQCCRCENPWRAKRIFALPGGNRMMVDNESRGKEDLCPTGRRGFFRDAAYRLVSPIADYFGEAGKPEQDSPRLRPPGAMEEDRFLTTCLRCGKCADACPADAIFLLNSAHGEAAGTPVIDPDRAACVVCERLSCTQVCQSGALSKLTDPSMIRMGSARVYEPMCARTQGRTCTACVDLCPLGESAIRFNDHRAPEVLSPGCVGCGVCQLNCPTSPKAITVLPR